MEFFKAYKEEILELADVFFNFLKTIVRLLTGSEAEAE